MFDVMMKIYNYAKYNYFQRKQLIKAIDIFTKQYVNNLKHSNDTPSQDVISYCKRCCESYYHHEMRKCIHCIKELCFTCSRLHNTCVKCKKCNINENNYCCQKCGDILCSNCILKTMCKLCLSNRCEKCIIKCCNCKKLVCSGCCNKCETCNGNMCKECIHNLSVCK
jgi:hypothetical protein